MGLLSRLIARWTELIAANRSYTQVVQVVRLFLVVVISSMAADVYYSRWKDRVGKQLECTS